MAKVKPIIDDLHFDALDGGDVLARVSEPLARVCDHVAGIRELPEPPYGVTAAIVGPGAIVVRTYAADPFQLIFRVGTHWLTALSIPRDDAGIRQLESAGKLIEYGETPVARQKREQREAEAEARRQFEAETKRQAQHRALARRARGLLKELSGRDLDPAVANKRAQTYGFESVEEARRYAP